MTQHHQFPQTLDTEGYILNPCHPDQIAPEFRPLVRALCEQLQARFAELHSVYLYGSVPRGDAKVARSDLDVCLVFDIPQAELPQVCLQTLQSLAMSLIKKYPVVTKVDFDPGILGQVLMSREHYRWHFWLKHCCCCIWGEDLALQFVRHRPHPAIAAAFAEDLKSQWQTLSTDLTPENSGLKGRTLAKKLIRTAYGQIAVQDQSWYHQLDFCVQAVLCHAPQYRDLIIAAFALAQDPAPDFKAVLRFVQDYAEPVQMLIQHVEEAS